MFKNPRSIYEIGITSPLDRVRGRRSSAGRGRVMYAAMCIASCYAICIEREHGRRHLQACIILGGRAACVHLFVFWDEPLRNIRKPCGVLPPCFEIIGGGMTTDGHSRLILTVRARDPPPQNKEKELLSALCFHAIACSRR